MKGLYQHATWPNHPTSQHARWKLLQAILALFALKGTVKGAAIGAVLVLILALYSLVASALVEVTSSIADLWIHSDSNSQASHAYSCGICHP